MPDNHLYEYAVVRFVPRVEREEFFNIGLIMMCKKQRWIKFQFDVNGTIFSAMKPDIALSTLNKALSRINDIAQEGILSPGADKMPVEERFRWLTAVKSACIQTSRPHPGLTPNLDNEFNRLYDLFVGQ